jgi:hypothetical protein
MDAKLRVTEIRPFARWLGAKSRSLVKPVSARPEVICRGWRGNFYNYNLDQVEAQDVRQVLETTIRSNPFSSFIRGFLAPCSGRGR